MQPHDALEHQLIDQIGVMDDAVKKAKELASLRKAAPDQILSSRDVWKDMAHAIFNLKEFLYLR